MNVLAFDTCFGAVSAAVRWRSADSTMREEAAYETRNTGHAERLMPMIEEIMAASGMSFADLESIAVTAGPGSFTGTRSGIAAARALALATGLPIRATSSLAVMATAAAVRLGVKARGERIAVAVDARRGEVYLQTFQIEHDGHVAALGAGPAVRTLQDAVRDLGHDGWIGVGSGAALIANGAMTVTAASAALEPDASTLARMAPALPVQRPLLPLYLRPADAKPPTNVAPPRVLP